MPELKPGKGLHIDLTQRNMMFVQACLQTIRDIEYTDEVHDEKPKVIIDRLKSQGNWEYDKDDFGEKVYRTLETSKGELRFTVILTKPRKAGGKPELKLDVRTWYEG